LCNIVLFIVKCSVCVRVCVYVCVHVCACGFPVFLPEMVNKVEYILGIPEDEENGPIQAPGCTA